MSLSFTFQCLCQCFDGKVKKNEGILMLNKMGRETCECLTYVVQRSLNKNDVLKKHSKLNKDWK